MEFTQDELLAIKHQGERFGKVSFECFLASMVDNIIIHPVQMIALQYMFSHCLIHMAKINDAALKSIKKNKDGHSNNILTMYYGFLKQFQNIVKEGVEISDTCWSDVLNALEELIMERNLKTTDMKN